MDASDAQGGCGEYGYVNYKRKSDHETDIGLDAGTFAWYCDVASVDRMIQKLTGVKVPQVPRSSIP